MRYALLVVAVSILVYGYFAGGTNDVLTKAINICTECVGLG
ncbi:MAG: thioredoxin [Oscillospiraceae bacterium]|nr:thioredoxin [Oscillospiraceae bacterium]